MLIKVCKLLIFCYLLAIKRFVYVCIRKFKLVRLCF